MPYIDLRRRQVQQSYPILRDLVVDCGQVLLRLVMRAAPTAAGGRAAFMSQEKANSDEKKVSHSPGSGKKPYKKPEFRFERVFEMLDLRPDVADRSGAVVLDGVKMTLRVQVALMAKVAPQPLVRA